MKRKAHYWTSKLFFKSLHKKNCQSKNESLFQSFILSFKKSCMSTCSLVRHSLLLVRRTPISENLYYTTLYWIKVKHWLDLVTNQTPDSQPLGHKHLSLSSTDFPEIPIFFFTPPIKHRYKKYQFYTGFLKSVPSFTQKPPSRTSCPPQPHLGCIRKPLDGW